MAVSIVCKRETLLVMMNEFLFFEDYFIIFLLNFEENRKIRVNNNNNKISLNSSFLMFMH